MRKIAIAAMLVLAVIVMASVSPIHAVVSDNVGPPSALLGLDLSYIVTPNRPVFTGPELAYVRTGANLDPGRAVVRVSTISPYFASQEREVALNRGRSIAAVSPAIARSGSSTPRHLLSTEETSNICSVTAGGAPDENGPSPTVLDLAAESGYAWT